MGIPHGQSFAAGYPVTDDHERVAQCRATRSVGIAAMKAPLTELISDTICLSSQCWCPAPDLSSTPRSLDFRLEEFLRTRGAHVGLGDEGYAGIDIGRHLFALRGGECRLDPIITHAEGILHH